MATGTASVTLSNYVYTAVTDPSDSNPNFITATRSDTGTTVNVNVGTFAETDTADITPLMQSAAQQLSDQDSLGAALVQDTYAGTATSANGTTTVTLHPTNYVGNLDGLVLYYVLTGNTAIQDVNLGTNSTPGDTTSMASASETTLQGLATDAATAARAAADAALGISTLSNTATSTTTI